MSGFCEKVKLIMCTCTHIIILRSIAEWSFLHYLTWDWFVDDFDDLHQVERWLLLFPFWPLSNFIGLDICTGAADDDDSLSVSWHPLRWKLIIKSQTDGGEGFVGGGRMYSICLNLFSTYYFILH